MSPLTVGSSIGRTNTEPRMSASATARGVSCRVFSSSRNAAAGFSVAMLKAFTRSPVTAATVSRSCRSTTPRRVWESFNFIGHNLMASRLNGKSARTEGNLRPQRRPDHSRMATVSPPESVRFCTMAVIRARTWPSTIPWASIRKVRLVTVSPRPPNRCPCP